MWKPWFGLVALAAAVTPLPAAAVSDSPGYYEWSTKRPFSGFAGVPPFVYYCDYIKYPIRKCASRTVCRRGKCYQKPRCKVVGWDIRQSCY